MGSGSQTDRSAHRPKMTKLLLFFVLCQLAVLASGSDLSEETSENDLSFHKLNRVVRSPGSEKATINQKKEKKTGKKLGKGNKKKSNAKSKKKDKKRKQLKKDNKKKDKGKQKKDKKMKKSKKEKKNKGKKL